MKKSTEIQNQIDNKEASLDSIPVNESRYESVNDRIADFIKRIDEWKMIANLLLRSKLLPSSIDTIEKAITIIMKGIELRLPPMISLEHINVIKGKPVCSAQLLMSLIHASKELENIKIDDDGNKCIITMARKGVGVITKTFSNDDAKNIKINYKDESGKWVQMTMLDKDNWKNWPSDMRQWRCISRIAKILFPDVTMGLSLPEEIMPEIPTDSYGGIIGSLPQDEDEMQQIPEKLELLNNEDKTISAPLFDPTKEVIKGGKYSGIVWARAPYDYLEFLSAKASSPEIKEKATYTIKYLDEISSQDKSDPFAGTFDNNHDQSKPITELFPEKNRTPEEIATELYRTLEFAGSKSEASLREWLENYSADVNVLPKELRNKVIQKYNAISESFKRQKTLKGIK